MKGWIDMFFKKDDSVHVLATVTEEEAQEFKDLSTKRESIQEMLEGLVGQLTEANKERRGLWENLYQKYGIDPDGRELTLNTTTREIRFAKRG